MISDIHGNLAALEAVLKSIEKESYDKLVFLGDAAATGPEPHNSLVRLKSKDPVCIMGNTDEWLLNPVPRPNPDPEVKIIEEIDRWCVKQLTDSDRDFLRSFKHMARVSIGGDAELLAYHGSPTSNREGVMPGAAPEALDAVLLGESATVMAGGHTHMQMLRRHKDSILINPGSVGLPFERDSATGRVRLPPWCEHAVITTDGGRVDVSFRRVPLDPAVLERSLSASSMPRRTEYVGTWTSLVGKMNPKD